MNKHAICLTSNFNSIHNFSFTASTARKSATTTRTAKNSSSSDSGEQSDHESTETSRQSERKSSKTIVAMRRPSIMAASLKSQHYGSFYLRMGAVGNYSSSLSLSVSQIEPQKFSVCTEVHISLDEATKFHVRFLHLARAVWRRTFFVVSLFQFQMPQITHVYRALNNNDASKYRTVRLISSVANLLRQDRRLLIMKAIVIRSPEWFELGRMFLVWHWFFSGFDPQTSIMERMSFYCVFSFRFHQKAWLLSDDTSKDAWTNFNEKVGTLLKNRIVVCN